MGGVNSVGLSAGSVVSGAGSGEESSAGASEQVCLGRRPRERVSSIRQALQSEDMICGVRGVFGMDAICK